MMVTIQMRRSVCGDHGRARATDTEFDLMLHFVCLYKVFVCFYRVYCNLSIILNIPKYVRFVNIIHAIIMIYSMLYIP